MLRLKFDKLRLSKEEEECDNIAEALGDLMEYGKGSLASSRPRVLHTKEHSVDNETALYKKIMYYMLINFVKC